MIFHHIYYFENAITRQKTKHKKLYTKTAEYPLKWTIPEVIFVGSRAGLLLDTALCSTICWHPSATYSIYSVQITLKNSA